MPVVVAAINNFTACNASAMASMNNFAGLAAQLVERCKVLLDRQEGSDRQYTDEFEPWHTELGRFNTGAVPMQSCCD